MCEAPRVLAAGEKLSLISRGYSSVGRASASHAEGPRFDSL